MLRLVRAALAFLVSGALPVLAPLVVLICCILAPLPAFGAAVTPSSIGPCPNCRYSVHAMALPALPVRHLDSFDWPLTRMGAPTAWAVGADGHGISIEVIDTGLDAVMRDTVLAGHILPSFTANPLHGQVAVACKTYIPYEASCTQDVLIPSPTPYLDAIAHGSFVTCEIVCNGTHYGIFGIAPGAKVAMAKVFGSADGADARDIAAAIRWGTLRHFAIISMSLGSSAEDPIIAAAVAFAVHAHVVVVAAAGNSGSRGLAYPAALPGVVSVGATDRWDRHARYSQYGAGLTISAPGDWVPGIGPAAPTKINCQDLCTWEGTSMATPYISGGLACLLSLGLSPANAKLAMIGGAYHWPGMDSTKFGAGVLSLPRAIQWAQSHHLPMRLRAGAV